MARPRLQIDPKQVELLASCFCTDEEIAQKLGCSSDTLTRRYAESLKKGRESAKASLRVLQLNHAKKYWGMAIWLGKQYLGQRDKIEQGTPEEFERLSDDELRRIINDPTYQGASLDAETEAGGDRVSEEAEATS